MQQSKKSRNLHTYAKFSGLAFEMLGIIAFGAWGGYKIDTTLNLTNYVFTIICSLFAVFAALYLVFKSIKKMDR